MDLESKTYAELQSIAKELGLKANMKVMSLTALFLWMNNLTYVNGNYKIANFNLTEFVWS